MTNLIVNGTPVECQKDNIKLIRFLRDDLRLTSVKEGCGEGACGTCMVLIDDKPFRACIPTVSKLAGKSIITLEGISEREKEVYAYSFALCGAVQCGFCIPGMIISAKALLAHTHFPTRSEIKNALRGNICRCTGYAKIEEAIMFSAQLLFSGIQIPRPVFSGKVGEKFYRVDAEEKVRGTGIFTDDIIVDNMVYAKALRSKYPRARILAIDYSEAALHPDCIRVITAEDVPGNIKCGHLVKDWDALIATGGVTRYVGDAIAIAVTNSQETLDEVLSLIHVDYEELTPLTSPAMSLTDGAALIHDNGNILSRQILKRGDAAKAIAGSKHVVTKHYSLPFTEHAFMEPECAIAMPEGSDGLLL
jgi:aerobic-type carbon monoxide dehydrogenase small subunit (CoxS/CutS family)